MRQTDPSIAELDAAANVSPPMDFGDVSFHVSLGFSCQNRVVVHVILCARQQVITCCLHNRWLQDVRTLHSANPNESKETRRAFVVIFVRATRKHEHTVAHAGWSKLCIRDSMLLHNQECARMICCNPSLGRSPTR